MVISTRKTRFNTIDAGHSGVSDDLFSNESPAKRRRLDEDMDDDMVDGEGSASTKPQLSSLPPTSTTSTTTSSSSLFAPHRTVGLITAPTPFSLTSPNSTHLLTTSVGTQFQIMNVREAFRTVIVGGRIPSKSGRITRVVSDGKVTFVGTTKGWVMGYRRNKCCDGATVDRGYRVGEIMVVGKTVIVLMIRKGGGVGEVGDTDSEDEDENEDEADYDSDSSSSSSSISHKKGTPAPSKLSIFHYPSPSNPLVHTSTIPLPHETVKAEHPMGYLNKVLLATKEEGGEAGLRLWNLKKEKMIHKFLNLPNEVTSSSITALKSTPAPDTVAIGTLSGVVSLFNLKYDVPLFKLSHLLNDASQTVPTGIRDISFRTDPMLGGTKTSPMAVGRNDGFVTVWDLQTRDKITSFQAHDSSTAGGSVVSSVFLPNEPILLTSGTDNAVKAWVFDGHDGGCRLLRERKGHTKPPTNIRYLQELDGVKRMTDGTDARSCEILTSGDDRTVRVFSTARSQVDVEWSQGSGLAKKAREMNINKSDLLLPPVKAVATATGMGKKWGDVVTIHENSPMAYAWSSERKAQTGATLRQGEWNVGAMQKQAGEETHAMSACVSACGNFALVGTRGGIIYKYNLQSGLERGTYPKNAKEGANGMDRKNMPSKLPGSVKRTLKMLDPGKVTTSNLDKKEMQDRRAAEEEERRMARSMEARHDDAVVGVAVDNTNGCVYSLDTTGKLCIWDFKTKAAHKKSPVQLPCNATKMIYVRDSDLAAICTDDYGVIVYDCKGMNVVRRMGGKGRGHSGPITGVAVGGGGRRIFTSSLDSTIRVWDIPTGQCIDWMSFKSPPTSVAVSPTGEFLATSHVNQLGIALWADRSFYQTVYLSAAPSKPTMMDDPAPTAEVDGKGAMEETLELSKLEEAKTAAEKKAMEGGEAGKKEGGEGDDGPVIPKGTGLVTTSGLPAGHWKNLFHLDLVKQRNKPKEAPKKPESAPFFLQRRSDFGGVLDKVDEKKVMEEVRREEKEREREREREMEKEKREKDLEGWDAAWSDDEEDDWGGEEGDVGDGGDGEGEVMSSRLMKSFEGGTGGGKIVRESRNKLAALLTNCAPLNHFGAVQSYLATLTPSAIDLAMMTLCSGPHDEDGIDLLVLFCEYLAEAFKTGCNFEAVHAYMNRFFVVHGETIRASDVEGKEEGVEERRVQQMKRFCDVVGEMKDTQEVTSKKLKGKLAKSMSLLRFLSKQL